MNHTQNPLPARVSADGRSATWNPALTRSARVVLRVIDADGKVTERASLNSGRAKVRDREKIEAVYPETQLESTTDA